MPTSIRLTAVAAAVALLAAACGGEPAADTIESPAYLAFRDQPTACGAERPEPALDLQFEQPEDMGLSGPVEVVLDTSCGDITMLLDADATPLTVNSFVFLATQGYYDGIALHRVVPGFMAQIGDPTATGMGNPGYLIPDEMPPADFLYERGVVAMANSGAPGSAGSQFFVMMGEAPLPPTYAVFGRVTSGIDVIDTMAAVPMGANPGDAVPSRPLETIYINSVSVTGG